MRRFADRTAVITGAASGIGRALALDLAGRGAHLALSDRNGPGAEDTADLCRGFGATALAYEVDVADRPAVFAHAAEVIGDFGSVDLVVNNAGVALHGAVSELEIDDMRWLMDINYWGVVHGTQAFLPHLLSSAGQVANISSVFGLVSVPKQAAYNAAKFAVRGFTEALRQEVRGQVAVSCVHPGGIRTDIARSARVSASEDSGATGAAFDRLARTSPQRAARTILRGLERERARILVGADAWFIAGLPRLLGAGYLPLVTRFSDRATR